MNKELLNNPEVKEIAELYNAYRSSKTQSFDWDDFVIKHTKPKDWEIYKCKNIETGELYYFAQVQQIFNWRKKYNINSVKRLSDGEVFTVGDKTWLGEIKSFHIRGNDMVVVGDSCNDNILTIQKTKQPLFATFDNEFIYDNEDYFHVDANFNLNYYLCSSTGCYPNDYAKKCFKYKAKAEEYILMNKPKLSIQSLLNSGTIVKGSPQYNQIVELAKTIE